MEPVDTKQSRLPAIVFYKMPRRPEWSKLCRTQAELDIVVGEMTARGAAVRVEDGDWVGQKDRAKKRRFRRTAAVIVVVSVAITAATTAVFVAAGRSYDPYGSTEFKGVPTRAAACAEDAVDVAGVTRCYDLYD